jgi:hypothetical protein
MTTPTPEGPTFWTVTACQAAPGYVRLELTANTPSIDTELLARLLACPTAVTLATISDWKRAAPGELGKAPR